MQDTSQPDGRRKRSVRLLRPAVWDEYSRAYDNLSRPQQAVLSLLVEGGPQFEPFSEATITACSRIVGSPLAATHVQKALDAPKKHEPTRPGYVAVFSPLRFGEAGGRPFATEVDAFMGGYRAARKIVDDLFSHEGR